MDEIFTGIFSVAVLFYFCSGLYRSYKAMRNKESRALKKFSMLATGQVYITSIYLFLILVMPP